MKTKHNLFIQVLIIFVLIFISAECNAFFNSDTRKAKKFMKVGMYPQAVELLNKRINQKPTDDSAHFYLGVCYIHLNDYILAEDRFSSALALKQKYSNKIGDEYNKAANLAFNKRELRLADLLFKKSLNYNTEYKSGAYKFYSKLCEEADGRDVDIFCTIALQYSQTTEQRQSIGEEFLKKAKQTQSKDRKFKLKKRAFQILGPPPPKTVNLENKGDKVSVDYNGCELNVLNTRAEMLYRGNSMILLVGRHNLTEYGIKNGERINFRFFSGPSKVIIPSVFNPNPFQSPHVILIKRKEDMRSSVYHGGVIDVSSGGTILRFQNRNKREEVFLKPGSHNLKKYNFKSGQNILFFYDKKPCEITVP